MTTACAAFLGEEALEFALRFLLLGARSQPVEIGFRPGYLNRHAIGRARRSKEQVALVFPQDSRWLKNPAWEALAASHLQRQFVSLFDMWRPEKIGHIQMDPKWIKKLCRPRLIP